MKEKNKNINTVPDCQVCVCVCFWYSRTYEDICLENYHGSGDACHQGDIFQGPTDWQVILSFMIEFGVPTVGKVRLQLR